MKFWWLLIGVATTAWAADLDTIRQAQKRVTALRGQHEETRGATAELTALKHQIRDWVETRIAKMNAESDLGKAAAEINADLKRIDLAPSDDFSELGGIGGIALEHAAGDTSWLVFENPVGLDNCGFDTSIYLYEWRVGQWNRRAVFETDPTAEKYHPLEGVTKVEISQPDAYQQRLVMLLGRGWGCGSMLHDVSLRLFRIGGQTKELVSEDFLTYFGDDDGTAYAGRLEGSGALVEYIGYGAGTNTRRHALHYEVKEDRVAVSGIALTAQDFVDDWIESHRVEMLKDGATGWYQFVQPCKDDPARWQIGFRIQRGGSRYFLVEEKAVHDFRMIDISKTRQPGCPGEGEPHFVGGPYPTLFPKTP